MLTQEDLLAIRNIIKEEVPNEVSRQLNLTMENIILPQLELLAEGQKTILETLTPKQKVEELETDIDLIKQVIKSQNNRISELEKKVG